MQQTMTSARRLWHPALPYALDYLGLVLITAVLSMLWFNRRLGSLLLAIPMGVAFTLLASLVFYRWQHRRWLKRKSALDRQALYGWPTNCFPVQPRSCANWPAIFCATSRIIVSALNQASLC